MLFNVNHTVKAKLTDHGREIHFKHWQAIMPHLPYKPPKEDEEGWSEWQLWDLMNQFGPHIGLGNALPFDAVIEFCHHSAEPLAQKAYVAFVQICKGRSDDAGTYQADEALVRRALRRLHELEGAELAEPESVSLEQGVQRIQPFVVKHYTEDERPTIKGNGFDGLEIGEDREEAEAFVAWINEKLARLGQQFDQLITP